MRTILGTLAVFGVSSIASAGTLYSNGFEVDTNNWFGATSRVSTGTGGIASSDGGFHATASSGSFSRWGGYNFGAGDAVPTAFQEYTTSLDIYLDVNGGFTNDTRFDYSSAINNSGGTHVRDFIITGGFYTSSDLSGPGAGTNRFVFSASNNAPGWPKDPNRSPVAIATSGWYTFQHHFYDNAGVLAVDLSILDSSNSPVASWTLSNAADLIGGIGGNRYGWFVTNGFGTLAIDNANLSTVTAVPLPAAVWAGFALLGTTGLIRRRG